MSRILALNTTSSVCSVALLNGDQVLSCIEPAERSHTQKLLPMIHSLLSEMAVSLYQLDAIAFTHGPGSFTGIRIGFAAVQGLAMGASLPVVPVSTMQLLATTASRKLMLPEQTQLHIALDARMDELYFGHYCVSDTGVDAVREDRLLPVCEILTTAADTGAVAIGDGWLQLSEAERPGQVYPEMMPEAEDLFPVATAHLACGKLRDIREVEPVYLRDRVSWKKRQRLREKPR